MNQEQVEAVYDRLEALIVARQEATTTLNKTKREITKLCRVAHDLGASDREISERTSGEFSRTRIQQLRTSDL